MMHAETRRRDGRWATGSCAWVMMYVRIWSDRAAISFVPLPHLRARGWGREGREEVRRDRMGGRGGAYMSVGRRWRAGPGEDGENGGNDRRSEVVVVAVDSGPSLTLRVCERERGTARSGIVATPRAQTGRHANNRYSTGNAAARTRTPTPTPPPTRPSAVEEPSRSLTV